jgi:hypothetical protein
LVLGLQLLHRLLEIGAQRNELLRVHLFRDANLVQIGLLGGLHVAAQRLFGRFQRRLPENPE